MTSKENKMPTIERVQALVDTVTEGRIADAIQEFYAEDVVMQENGNPPTVGKPANTDREDQFVKAITAVHENRAEAVLVDGNRASIHWIFEFTNAEGTRIRLDQIALQEWREDKIVRERFFYDSANVVVA